MMQMKKFYFWFFLLFIGYSILISYYLLHAPASLPISSKGGPADPATFMTPAQLVQAEAYSRINDIGAFISDPYQWVIYLFLLCFGLSAKFRDLVQQRFKRSIWQISGFVFLVSLIATLLNLPINFYFFRLEHIYGVSNETIGHWAGNHLKSFVVSFILMTFMVWLFYTFVRRSPKKWWIWLGMLAIPISLFFMYIQPVVIDPIYHNFSPLKDQQLKTEILDLAKRAGIPEGKVYQVDMSKTTNTLNAYVNGIGSNTRIVLWDTLLKKLKKDEILFIMAHEMGHYALHHMRWLFLGTVGMAFVALYLLYYLIQWISQRAGKAWGIRGVDDLASLPAILLILSILSFVSLPVQNAVSRHFEHAADVYAMDMLHDPNAAIRSFQRLAVESLSEVNPPPLVKFVYFNHPTLYERIQFVKDYGSKGDKKG
jgi:STE24 endopeptidase